LEPTPLKAVEAWSWREYPKRYTQTLKSGGKQDGVKTKTELEAEESDAEKPLEKLKV
jgi:hypothetical protein